MKRSTKIHVVTALAYTPAAVLLSVPAYVLFCMVHWGFSGISHEPFTSIDSAARFFVVCFTSVACAFGGVTLAGKSKEFVLDWSRNN